MFAMVKKSKELTQPFKNLISSKQGKQLRLDVFPSGFQKESPIANKKIVISRIEPVTKYDEMALVVDFRLFPSKVEFSKVRLTLWFDGEEVNSELIRIPQGFGVSDEFQLKLELDMRGISPGVHSVKVELHDLFSPCFDINKKTIEYVPLDKKASYRKIPIAKKILGSNFVIVSSSNKKIYSDIAKTRKSELNSKKDRW